MPISFTRATWTDYVGPPFMQASEANRLETALDALINGSSRAVQISGDTMTGNLTVNGWIEGDQGFRDAGGVTRISATGAGVFSQGTVQDLTPGQIVVPTSGGRLAGTVYATGDSVGGDWYFGGSQSIGSFPTRGVYLKTAGASFRSPRVELVETSASPSWSTESYFGLLRFVSGYNTSPVPRMTLSSAGMLTLGDSTASTGTTNARLTILQRSDLAGGGEIYIAGNGAAGDENSGKLYLGANARAIGRTDTSTPLKLQIKNSVTGLWETALGATHTNAASPGVLVEMPLRTTQAMTADGGYKDAAGVTRVSSTGAGVLTTLSTSGLATLQSVNISGLTASRMLSLDASKNVVSLDAEGSRALIRAAVSAYGGIIFAGDEYTTPATQAFTASSSWNKLTIFTGNTFSDNCTPEHANDRILSAEEAVYRVSCNLSISASTPAVVYLAICKNNAHPETPPTKIVVPAGGNEIAVSLSQFIGLSVGEYVDIRLQSPSTAFTMTVNSATLDMVAVQS